MTIPNRVLANPAKKSHPDHQNWRKYGKPKVITITVKLPKSAASIGTRYLITLLAVRACTGGQEVSAEGLPQRFTVLLRAALDLRLSFLPPTRIFLYEHGEEWDGYE